MEKTTIDKKKTRIIFSFVLNSWVRKRCNIINDLKADTSNFITFRNTTQMGMNSRIILGFVLTIFLSFREGKLH